MKRTAEVTIIGGGVIGASVAYHLAERGCRDVIVIERGHALCAGSTSRATGGFRAQFATTINVQLSLLSRGKLERFREELGIDPGYRPCGYLFLAQNQGELDVLAAAQRVQHAAGLTEAVAVSPAEIRRLNPAIEATSLEGGVFCPRDGTIVPFGILRGYVTGAERLGARFHLGVSCEAFTRGARGQIEETLTSSGRIASRVVVNAAGPWAAEVAALAGAEIAVAPLRRQVAVTHPTDVLPVDMPMTIYAGDGFHFRVRDRRVLLLAPSPAPADPFDTSVDAKWVAGVEALARTRVPCLAATSLDSAACWAGLYEMSPDRHALLGPAPGVENLVLVNGSSGHGVMHAPALGQLAAELITDGAARTLDIRCLRPERFAEDEPNSSTDLL